MREPVFQLVVGHLLGLRVARSGASCWHAPDVPSAAAIGIEVDPFAIGRVFGSVVVAALRGEALLGAASGGHTKEFELAGALADESQPFSVRRPAVKIAGRGGRHQARARSV